MDGDWYKMPADDPASLPREDQIRAEALDRIRNARSFMSLTITAAEDGVRVSAILASLTESLDSENGMDDTGAIESTLCENMVRMWFDDVPPRSEANGIDMLAVILERHQLIENVMATIHYVLAEKGYH
jgi:hypothetical protein